MELLTRFMLGLIGILTLIVVRSLVRAVLDPLRDQPGPVLARFSRLWYLRALLEGHFEKTNLDLHRKFGTVTISLL
jgi:hypothetical protein